MVRALAIKTSWREGVRVVVIGGATSFGFGDHIPTIMKPWIGELPGGAYGTGAFLVGLLASALVERLIAKIDPPAGGDDERA